MIDTVGQKTAASAESLGTVSQSLEVLTTTLKEVRDDITERGKADQSAIDKVQEVILKTDQAVAESAKLRKEVGTTVLGMAADVQRALARIDPSLGRAETEEGGRGTSPLGELDRDNGTGGNRKDPEKITQDDDAPRNGASTGKGRLAEQESANDPPQATGETVEAQTETDKTDSQERRTGDDEDGTELSSEGEPDSDQEREDPPGDTGEERSAEREGESNSDPITSDPPSNSGGSADPTGTNTEPDTDPEPDGETNSGSPGSGLWTRATRTVAGATRWIWRRRGR